MSKNKTEVRAEGGYVERDAKFVIGSNEGTEVFVQAKSDQDVHIEPMKPAAQLVLDKELADEWLHVHYKRVSNVFRSIRLEPEGIDEDDMGQVIRIAVAALRSRGVLYVPASLDVKSYALSINPVEKPQEGYFHLVKI